MNLFDMISNGDLAVWQLADLALASPQFGILNLSVLHSLLHLVIQELNIQNCKVKVADPLKQILFENQTECPQTPRVQIQHCDREGAPLPQSHTSSNKSYEINKIPDDYVLQPNVSVNRGSAHSTGTVNLIRPEMDRSSLIDILNIILDVVATVSSSKQGSSLQIPSMQHSPATNSTTRDNSLVQVLEVLDILPHTHHTATAPKTEKHEASITDITKQQQRDDASKISLGQHYVKKSELREMVKNIVEQCLSNSQQSVPQFAASETFAAPNILEKVQRLINKKLGEHPDQMLQIRDYYESCTKEFLENLEKLIVQILNSKHTKENSKAGLTSRPQTHIKDEAVPQANHEYETNNEPQRPRDPDSKRENKNKRKPNKQTTDFDKENKYPKRYCGGTHTCTTPAERVFRKGNFRDQYYELVLSSMKNKDKVKSYGRPPNDACYGINRTKFMVYGKPLFTDV